MRRAGTSLLRVALSAVALLGGLSIAVVALGQPGASGAGPLTLADPAPLTAVDYSAPPLKVLLVGDSLAGSLGAGLGQVAAAYNVELANAGFPGCSLSMQGHIQLTFSVDRPGWPCVLDHPEHVLSVWQDWVDAYRPDVVLYLARGDLLTQQLDGRWTHLGYPRFASWFHSRLGRGITVLSSRGARVVLMTVPISQQNTLQPRPADRRVRVRRDARQLRLAAAGRAEVSVYRLARLLTPRMTYRASAQGMTLRCADGVHLTAAAGMVVGADLFPRLWLLGGGHRVEGGGSWAHGRFPTTTPRWYTRLACG